MKYLNIPKNIFVGVKAQKGFVTYKDGSKIAKEVSFNNWVGNGEKKDFENIPTSGFKLVGCVGGQGGSWYSYNRRAWAIIKDPRGFEIEITFDNLLWVMSQITHDVDKGFIGEFVYGWDGKDLMIVPTTSKDYQYTLTIQKTDKVKLSECEVGKWYKYPNESPMLYLGYLYLIKDYVRTKSDDNEKTEYVVKKYRVFESKGYDNQVYYDCIQSTKKDIIPCNDRYPVNNVEDRINAFYNNRYDNPNILNKPFKNLKNIVPDNKILRSDIGLILKDIKTPYQFRKTKYGFTEDNLDKISIGGSTKYGVCLFNKDFTDLTRYFIHRIIKWNNQTIDEYVKDQERIWYKANKDKYFIPSEEKEKFCEEFRKNAKRFCYIYPHQRLSISDNNIVTETINHYNKSDFEKQTLENFIKTNDEDRIFVTTNMYSKKGLQLIDENNYKFKMNGY